MTDDNYLLYSVLASVLPALLYVGIIYWADRYEKEPLWLLSATFLWGAIPGPLLALFFNAALSLPFYFLFSASFTDFASSGAIAPVVEEIAKGLALFMILFIQRNELDSPLDGIIYGAMVGMGFAMVENVVYYISYFEESGGAGWNELVLMRGMIFGLNHALYTSMTGLGIALSRVSKHKLIRIIAPFLGLMAAMMLHAIHNIAMMGGAPRFFLAGLVFDWGGVVMTILVIALALYKEQRWMRRYLREEVELGTLTADEYHIVQSAALRSRYRLGLLFTEGPAAFVRSGQRFRRLSELAYCKRRYAHFSDEDTLRNIASLRGSIAGLGVDESPGAAV